MKKLLILVITAVSVGIIAKPLQRQIAKLEKASSLYAKNEEQSWQRISDLNKRLSYLEQKILKYKKERSF